VVENGGGAGEEMELTGGNNEERMRHGAEGAIQGRKHIQLKAPWAHGRTGLARQIGGLG
jgi:hypothetical protein